MQVALAGDVPDHDGPVMNGLCTALTVAVFTVAEIVARSRAVAEQSSNTEQFVDVCLVTLNPKPCGVRQARSCDESVVALTRQNVAPQ